jgi:hypothetical protein
MSLRRLGISILVVLVLLVALTYPFIAVTNVTQTSETLTTPILITIRATQTTTRSWSVSDCITSQCPEIKRSSAVLVGVGTLALDVAVSNPTVLPVSALVVRFDYWDPYTCATCSPDYTTRITFEVVAPGATQTKHIEVRNTSLFLYAVFHYSFQIEAFVTSQSTVVQRTSTSSRLSVIQQTFAHTGSVAVYDLVLPGRSKWPAILATFGVAILLCVALIWRRVTRRASFERRSASKESHRAPETSGPPVDSTSKTQTSGKETLPSALDPEFRVYRDRLQESLLAGEIDEREYVRLLSEFQRSKKQV